MKKWIGVSTSTSQYRHHSSGNLPIIYRRFFRLFWLQTVCIPCAELKLARKHHDIAAVFLPRLHIYIQALGEPTPYRPKWPVQVTLPMNSLEVCLSLQGHPMRGYSAHLRIHNLLTTQGFWRLWISQICLKTTREFSDKSTRLDTLICQTLIKFDLQGKFGPRTQFWNS